MQNHRCQRVPPDAYWLQSRSSGLLLPPACRAWSCEVCGPRAAVRLGRALDAAGYDRTVTITRAPSDLLQGVRRLRHRLAARGPFEWVWAAERGPKTGMVHIHAVIRGVYWDAKGRNSPMHRECRKAGWGFPAPRRHAAVGAYASKGAVYTTKLRKIDYAGWRTLNGGVKPWHWSRGYTGGLPMRDFVRLYAPSTDPGPWDRIRPRDLPADLTRDDGRAEKAAEAAYWAAGGALHEQAVLERAAAVALDMFGEVEAPAAIVVPDLPPATPKREHAFSRMPRKRWRPDGF